VLTPETVLHSPEFDRVAGELAETGRFLAERGWSPATSSNYSARFSVGGGAPARDGASGLIAISRTGVDKFVMAPTDVMVIEPDRRATAAQANAAFRVVAPADARPSAETKIHTAIYAVRTKAQAVLHAHSPNNTRLSMRFLSAGALTFTGYEMQKGLEGVATHEGTVRVPILANSQNMDDFALHVEELLRREPTVHAFLIAGHGVYSWSSSLATARRHIETLEFLFSCRALELMGV
jgi:methylthioribulose-1-phosphate dehydratase